MHQIELPPNAEPYYRCYYRMFSAESAELKKAMDEYLAKGWIKPSCSPWGAPIIFLRKKTGELRMRVDYCTVSR